MPNDPMKNLYTRKAVLILSIIGYILASILALFYGLDGVFDWQIVTFIESGQTWIFLVLPFAGALIVLGYVYGAMELVGGGNDSAKIPIAIWIKTLMVGGMGFMIALLKGGFLGILIGIFMFIIITWILVILFLVIFLFVGWIRAVKILAET